MLNTLFRISIITPAGNTYDLNDLGFYFAEQTDGFGMPPLFRTTVHGDYQHGVTDCGFRLKKRYFKFKIDARAATPVLHYARRAELLKAFKPTDQPLIMRITLPDATTRAIDCFLSSGLSFPILKPAVSTKMSKLVTEDIVELYAPDPTFYDPTAKTVSWFLSNLDNLLFPCEFPIMFGSGVYSGSVIIDYAGSWESFPTVQVCGPFTYFEVKNITRNKKLAVTYNAAAGETVTIDTRYGHKTVLNNYGSDLRPYLSSDSNLDTFSISDLNAGLNEVSFSATGLSSGSYIWLGYYDRFLGI